jgi:hypothetical protein
MGAWFHRLLWFLREKPRVSDKDSSAGAQAIVRERRFCAAPTSE